MHRPRRRTGFRRRALVIAVLTTAVASVMVLFGVQSVQRIQAVKEHWAVYSQDAAQGTRELHAISRQLGYGGYIHNFKNYVLRRDLDYVATLIRDRDAIYAALDQLENYVISQEEKMALVSLRKVFDMYASALPRAVRAFNRGLSSVEVDIMVKVDDGPALNAIDMLNHSFLMRASLAERETEKAMDAAASMVWVFLAVVPVVVLLGVVLILFLRRIVDATLNLAELRDELAMLLRQAPDAILHVGSDGHILRANDRALALFDYSRDELLQKNVEDLIPGRYRNEHVGIRKNAFEDMSSRPVGKGALLYAVTRDGAEIPVDISLNFSLSGGRRIATAIVRDVTERKRAEEALREAHDELGRRVKERTLELEQRTSELEAEFNERQHAESQLIQSAKMATIGEMASGITHELNQPMNIMRMGVEAMQIRIQRGEADMDLVSETLGRVENQILRMSDIIDHMRVFSRKDSDAQVSFAPHQAVREGCKLFAGQLSGVNVELEISLPDAGEGEVLGYASRLEQVMLNLLSNARDAVLSHQKQMGNEFDGRIVVDMVEDYKNEKVIIRVQDNGGGIPIDVLPHIFAPFVTTKESGHGTGLGLSISYGIIEGMGGTIGASNTDEGAQFEIALPLIDGEQLVQGAFENLTVRRDVRPSRIARDLKDSAKVLVVDDEVFAANSLSDFLQELGYLVYTAYNGEEAMQIYKSDPVDVVITDLRMPIMDGEELIRQLRAVSQNLPIFAMTGQDPVGEEKGGPTMAATQIWRKPISIGEIAQHLEDVCGPVPAR